jgi:hypothetical protein
MPLVLQAPCGLNQAINLAATASSVLSKELKVACKDCPEVGRGGCTRHE